MTDRLTRPQSRLLLGAVAGLTVVLAIVVRFAFINQVSGDYRSFVSPWYDQLASSGFAGLGSSFSNYNPPYLYLLAAVTYLPLPKIVAIKAISMLFDVVLAGFAALIVRERFRRPLLPLVTFAAVLFAPTVVINSSAWGQCDSVYAAFCLGSLYFLIRRRPWWACIFFALGLSFKLQAIFFLPVLIIVMVVNKERLRALLAVPAVFAVMLLPAAIAGRDMVSLLSIYPDQITTGGTATGFRSNAAGSVGRGGVGGGGGDGFQGFGPGGAQVGGSNSDLTQNAPTFYQWLGSGASTVWKYIGLVAAGLMVLFAGVVSWPRRRRLTTAEIVVLATTLVLAVPFLLPQMHERYFYLADVLSIVMAFFVRRYWPVAILVSLCSLLSYAPFLWGSTPVALPLVAFGEFLAVLATLWVFLSIMRDPEQSALIRVIPGGQRNGVESAGQSPGHPWPIR